jgi:hypothetical protein
MPLSMHVVLKPAPTVLLALVPRRLPEGSLTPLLDRWESSLRRMPSVIDAMDVVLGTLWRVRLVRIVVVLIVTVILAVSHEPIINIFQWQR